MSTYEDLPGDGALLGAFPEAAGFLESGVTTDVITLMLHQEQLDVLQSRFVAVRELFDIFMERFRSETTLAEQWQSFHKFKRTDGEQRLWVINDTSGPALRAVSNEEARDEDGVSIRYKEFAVHPHRALFGMRSGTARRPVSIGGWQTADLGTCALIEHRGDSLGFSRGEQSGPAVLDGLHPMLGPFEQLQVVTDMSEGLGELEQHMMVFLSGSCHEPGVIGKFK